MATSSAAASPQSLRQTELPSKIDDICPNCLHPGREIIYRVGPIPVHSVLLMESREQALGYPRRDLELAFCAACGFVSNRAFDPSVHEYSPQCEETQGFSETFNAFARQLAQELVDRHALHGKTILEIGCGKGEFLNLLCRLGGNCGVGVDPAYVPERGDPALADSVEFLQDFYGPQYAHLAADFICCRHTLEHLAPTHEFMTTLRQTLGDRRETLVFFELPDVRRVLEEGAFWDLYYEHCSYFTAGSLARLFRSTGFEVLDVETVYAGQYLLLTAQPTDTPAPPVSVEDDLAEVRAAAAAFPTVVAQTQQQWRDLVERIAEAGQTAVLWGSGSKGVAFLTTLRLKDEIAAVVDINPYRQGKFMPGAGHRIIAPEELRTLRPHHVIVMNPIYCGEIQHELDRLGIVAELHAL